MKSKWTWILSLALVLGACDEKNEDEAPVMTCTENVCASEVVLQRCVNGVPTKEECEANHYCADGECRARTFKTCDIKPYCDSDGKTLHYCEANQAATMICDDGCEAGQCKDPVVVPDPCPGCEGTCDRGVCVTNAMKAVKAGDACSPDFVPFCREDSMVYCNTKGSVVISDCAENGGCHVVKGQDTGLDVSCGGPAEKCTAVGDPIPYCGELSGMYYTSRYVCSKDTEGNFIARDQLLYGMYNLCEFGCNAEKTDCEKLTECSFITKCDGDTLISCKDYTEIGEKVVQKQTDCAEKGLVCAMSGNQYACNEVCDEKDVGNVTYACLTDMLGHQVSISKTCTKSSSKFYNVEKKTICQHGCDTETGDCHKYHEKEGQVCLDSFKPVCENGVALNCVANKIYTNDCVAEHDSNWGCQIVDTTAACLEKCDEVNETVKYCAYDAYYEANLLYETTCMEGDDGNHYRVYDEDKSIICFSGCNEAGDACQYPEGESCDPDELKPHCEGDYVVSCYVPKNASTGELEVENCRDYGANYTCAPVNDEFGCFEKCPKLGEQRTVCKELYGIGAIAQSYECWYDDAMGELVWMEDLDYELCTRGCNYEATGCKEDI